MEVPTEPSKRTITHSASGASCEILDFGACLLSYKTGEGRECIFVSRDAKMDGTKAVRGGIPLVFPQFGQPDTSMPQHGFLRVNFWKVDESSAFDNENGAGIRYTLDLKDVKKARGGKWDEGTDLDCICSFHVGISSKTIITKLEIQNTGGIEFPFQNLMHTYYFVDERAALDGSHCYVKGLEGYSCFDKVTKAEYTVGSDPVVIEESLLLDRVHTPPAGKDDVDVIVGVGPGKALSVKASGTVGGETVPVSCVVWNPNKDGTSKLSDFGDDQYQDMICVEPGILEMTTLKAGEYAELVQITGILE